MANKSAEVKNLNSFFNFLKDISFRRIAVFLKTLGPKRFIWLISKFLMLCFTVFYIGILYNSSNAVIYLDKPFELKIKKRHYIVVIKKDEDIVEPDTYLLKGKRITDDSPVIKNLGTVTLKESKESLISYILKLIGFGGW